MPARGDVVVFRLPRDPKITYVKRVIGLPGDRIQMQEGRLFINGAKVPLINQTAAKVENEDGSSAPAMRFTEILPGGVAHPILKLRWDGFLDNTAVFTVPAGHLFMMGDNRDNSLDSRVTADNGGVGFVPAENLVGRAEFVVGSYDFLNAHAIWTWLKEFRLSRFFNGVS
jgi:signal peptidase I